MRYAVALTVVVLVFPFATAQAPKGKDTQTLEVGGKSMEQWIKELHSTDPSKRETAIRSIAAFGPDRAYQAVYDMLIELKKHDPNNPNKIVDLSVRVNLCMAIGEILGTVKGPEPKYVQEAVSLLKRQLGDPQAIMRYRAAEALWRIGPEAKSAIDPLIKMTSEFLTWENRQIAATALGTVAQDPKVGPDSKVTDALYKKLQDPAFQVRLASIRSLALLGGPGDPRLRAAMKNNLEPVASSDADPTVRIWAHMAIMSMGDIDEKRMATIGNMLRTSKDMGARVQAAQALGTLGPKARPQIGALIAGLSDTEPMVVYWCIQALGDTGTAGTKAVPELQKIIADPKQPEPLRKAAEESVNDITGKDKKK